MSSPGMTRGGTFYVTIPYHTALTNGSGTIAPLAEDLARLRCCYCKNFCIFAA
jgi:hypothetical protein